MPSPEAARIFLWLAQYPWRAVTWFGPGHSIRWYHEPATFPLGGGNEAVLLLDDPGRLLGPEVPDLSGFSFAGEPVRWLWILPITERERLLAKERGSAAWSPSSPRSAAAGSSASRVARPGSYYRHPPLLPPSAARASRYMRCPAICGVRLN